MHTILTITVAAGSGTRMGTDTPKQFLSLAGKPIVMRTLERISAGVDHYLAGCLQNVNDSVKNPTDVDKYVHKSVLVLPRPYIPMWRELCAKHDFQLPHEVVPGGKTRFHSVKNGLAAVPDAAIVLVHDGVRPFANDRTITEIIVAAQRYGAAVPTIPVVDSLRRRNGTDGGSDAVERSAYRAVQTPQGFRGDRIRKAYAAPYDKRFTDDASVVELTGTGRIALTEGSPDNLKITTPIDLAIAEILSKR